MRKGFDEDGFRNYLERNFDGYNNPFLRRTIDNIIDYGHRHEQVSKDMFVEWLADMIPGVTFGEVAQFAEDAILTERSIKAKKLFLQGGDDILESLPESGYFLCQVCGAKVYGGEGDQEEWLWGHIQRRHPDVFEEMQDLESPDMIEECYQLVTTEENENG